MRELSGLRLLFLAQYADASSEGPELLHPRNGIFANYHIEIRNTLLSLGIPLLATADFEALFERRHNFNYVFSLYNKARFRGAEIFVSAVCEFLQVPYLGAPPHTRALALDKPLAKLYGQRLNIPTPNWLTIGTKKDIPEAPPFKGPYFIKPRFGSASRGIQQSPIAKSWEEAATQARLLVQKKEDVIVEQFIKGKNLTVGVLGGDPPLILPVVETRSSKPGNVETYRQKRLLEPGNKRIILNEDSVLGTEIQALARKFFLAVQPLDYARFDFRWNSKSGPMFLEFNVCCNLGTHSTIATPARELGMSQADVVGQILKFSLKRQHVSG